MASYPSYPLSSSLRKSRSSSSNISRGIFSLKSRSPSPMNPRTSSSMKRPPPSLREHSCSPMKPCSISSPMRLQPSHGHQSRDRKHRSIGGASFDSIHGSSGVLLKDCLYGNPSEHVQNFDQPIILLLPTALHKAALDCPETQFIVDWPGYNHLDICYDFRFRATDNDLLTVGEMVKQIAEIYQWWYRRNHDKFRDTHGATRVGPKHASYETMRLRELTLVPSSSNLWKAVVTHF